ncbi:MAG TPA: decarboxylating 6-phosphogluconate dehydrogenase [Pseudobacteroides sp.]|uniref:phosphogluconate dehydrogenase (NAD(+)-dependent, decarboxylating) n=1 Tax=Pseudobacteroides sp. TaxID=1968840 RepID=UPI002F93E91B
MIIGLVGLGKMGLNLALNMKDNNHNIIAFEISRKAAQEAKTYGIESYTELETFIDKMSGSSPKIIWLMIPAGKPVDDMIDNISPYLSKGDILIDGGNSNYKDTLRRFEKLEPLGIEFVDIGTSGGMEGARNGICAMIGASQEAYNTLKPLLESISIENGFIHTGPNGSGHFVKMVHNGIEYGMMQAIGEGFEILKESRFDLDLESIADVWNNGSVIRGWLMELAARMFKKDAGLNGIKGIVQSSGEGLWTVQEALELKVAAPVITESLFARYRSEKEDTFTGKVVAGLRNEFGGHSVVKK